MKNIKVKSFFLLVLVFLISLNICGCRQNFKETNSSLSDKKSIIAVSIIPQESFIKAIARDLVDIIVLIPPGNSPENYAPSPQQLVQLSEASLYFSIGVPTEKANILPKIPDINKNLKVIDLAKNVAEIYPQREFAPNNPDPHIWLSPKRVKIMVETMTRELSEIDPQNKMIYEENAKKYLKQISDLDIEIAQSLNNLPQKTFIVYHPAFGYFAEDYNLKMVAIEEEGKQATIESIKNIIILAKEQNIKVVFYQVQSDNRQAKTIAQEIGGKTELIDPLAPNYLQNIEKIAETLSTVLKGQEVRK